MIFLVSLVKHLEKNIMTSLVFVIKHLKTKSVHLISWDEEFTEKSVAHWSKAKLKGSEKENKNSNNEDAASEHLTEEKAAK